ncbi:queuosine salvage family protein [Nitrosomonas marina]|uniref:Queuosine 5'-phosphate N-glycosylase/hydrolase n=1 Tax=Nitrosomonas marina TaxID=917 RepID=A0A1H8FEI4_9PROT|nr:queuosine salvage family protein [Nitrosomonas marina]SEN30139.1 Potential Queuosine, Q, salvage protein family [Nitrosomonas marina]
MEDLLKSVIESCQKVSKKSKYVHINEKAILSYIRKIPKVLTQAYDYDAKIHYFDKSRENLLNYIFILGSVNFGSGFLLDTPDRSKQFGYRTIASRLKEYFENNHSLSSDRLISLNLDCSNRIFKIPQDTEDGRQIGMLYRSAIAEMGQFIENQYNGSFSRAAEEALESTQIFLEKLINLNSFGDIAICGGQKVYFLKKAQLLIADIIRALNYSPLSHKKLLAKLTIFPDNHLANVLRIENILEYSSELKNKVDNKIELLQGTDEEVELRAATVCAGQDIVQNRKKFGFETNAVEIDWYLWNVAKSSYTYTRKATHKTKTLFY